MTSGKAATIVVDYSGLGGGESFLQPTGDSGILTENEIRKDLGRSMPGHQGNQKALRCQERSRLFDSGKAGHFRLLRRTRAIIRPGASQVSCRYLAGVQSIRNRWLCGESEAKRPATPEAIIVFDLIGVDLRCP